jgi:hypothetical protein
MTRTTPSSESGSLFLSADELKKSGDAPPLVFKGGSYDPTAKRLLSVSSALLRDLCLNSLLFPFSIFTFLFFPTTHGSPITNHPSSEFSLGNLTNSFPR